jgi:hypothetical protein
VALDLAELQQIIHDWDSVTEGDRNDEFSQGSTPLHKDVMPQHEEVIKKSIELKHCVIFPKFVTVIHNSFTPFLDVSIAKVLVQMKAELSNGTVLTHDVLLCVS